MSGISIINEAEIRFGWKERRAREYLKTLQELIAVDGKSICVQSFRGHAKVFEINKSTKFAMPLTRPTDIVQSCSKPVGNNKGAVLWAETEE